MSEHQFQQAVDEELRNYKRPTILVWGYTGNGKSSLIRSILGPDAVPDDEIGHGGKPRSHSFKLWESDLVRIHDSKGFENGQSAASIKKFVLDFVQKCQAGPNIDDHIHVSWYTINGAVARIQDSDLDLMKVLPETLVVITKKDLMDPEEIEANRSELLRRGVPQDRILFVSKKDPESIKQLIHRTLDVLPGAYKRAFRDAQLLDLDAKRSEATKIVHMASAAAAAAAGANPLPLSDALLITPIQIGMTVKLAFVYGEPAAALKMQVGPMIVTALGKTLASSLLKLIPVLGQVVNAGVALGLTEAVGHSLIAYLEARAKARLEGRPLPDINRFIDTEKIAAGAKKERR